MRIRAGALPLAVVGALALQAPPTAAAGGVTAPAPAGGGAEYNTVLRSTPAPRPVAREFTVTPTRMREGRAPRIRVRVDQRGARRVHMRVVVLPVGQRAAAARLTLGWRSTGRRHTVRWARGARLQPGRYLVRLHVKDTAGRTLRRRARTSGRSTLTVLARPRPPAPKPAPAPAPSGDGVFPVAGPYTWPGAGGSFGADRGSHRHEGQDISAAEGTPIVAPRPGVVSSTSYQADGAGEYVVVDGDDGRSYFFAHCRRRSTVVKVAERVAAGGRLCDVGSTGRSSGPHLHFEIWVGGWRRGKDSRPIDPLPDLRAWAGG